MRDTVLPPPTPANALATINLYFVGHALKVNVVLTFLYSSQHHKQPRTLSKTRLRDTERSSSLQHLILFPSTIVLFSTYQTHPASDLTGVIKV
jgi:hypothetical protein